MGKELRGLPDYLCSGMSILFVGINPGIRSAEVGHHFAGHTNRFWKLLFDAGLIPVPIRYEDDWRMPEFGYGLTNIIARPTAGAHNLKPQEFQCGSVVLMDKIQTHQPGLVALLGVSMARLLLFPKIAGHAHPRSSRNALTVGLQTVSLGGAPVFVLPNPSGRNAHYSYQYMKQIFTELKLAGAAHVKGRGALI